MVRPLRCDRLRQVVEYLAYSSSCIFAFDFSLDERLAQLFNITEGWLLLMASQHPKSAYVALQPNPVRSASHSSTTHPHGALSPQQMRTYAPLRA